MEYPNLFIPKPVWRPKYSTFFEDQGFFMQGLQRIYLFVALEIPKELDLLLALLCTQTHCNNIYIQRYATCSEVIHSLFQN